MDICWSSVVVVSLIAGNRLPCMLKQLGSRQSLCLPCVRRWQRERGCERFAKLHQNGVAFWLIRQIIDIWVLYWCLGVPKCRYFGDFGTKSGPKVFPRCPKSPPKEPKGCPREPKECPKGVQRELKDTPGSL